VPLTLTLQEDPHELRSPNDERVAVGQKLTVSFPFHDREVEARVDCIDSQVDEQTHTVKLRAPIPNPKGRLRAGMLVRMAVQTDAQPDRIGESPRQGQPDNDATPKDRLSELERKVDPLSGDREERLSHARILERLEALERKLDQLLGGRR
jgi:multidrug efflux pump subunit AcrA (membrane-fusion protein)